jgi:hypothetical protein
LIIVGHTSGTKFMSGQSLTICRNRLNSFCGELEFGTSSKALSIIQSPYCPEIPRYDISYNNPISMESNISNGWWKKPCYVFLRDTGDAPFRCAWLWDWSWGLDGNCKYKHLGFAVTVTRWPLVEKSAIVLAIETVRLSWPGEIVEIIRIECWKTVIPSCLAYWCWGLWSNHNCWPRVCRISTNQ